MPSLYASETESKSPDWITTITKVGRNPSRLLRYQVTSRWILHVPA